VDEPTLVTIAAANFASVPGDKDATLAKIERVVRDAARQAADLVVFPELALNDCGPCPGCLSADGPCPHHLAVAETVPGPSTRHLAAVAAELGVHVIVGMAERDAQSPGRLYNASALITPTGIAGTYRKLHLGLSRSATHPTTEGLTFVPGDALPVWETALGPIGILICYDFWSNPELARILALKGARLLVNTTASAAGPGKADYVAHTTVVRAQENLVYAVSSNRVDHGVGNSTIAGPAFPAFNHVFARAGTDEALLVATIDFAQLQRWHDVFPWREWRNGRQSSVSKLVAEEFSALA